MILPAYYARDLLAANLERLMAEHPDRGSPAKLAKVCFWPAGTKKAGKRVSERQIRYVLDGHSDESPSPTIDLVTALAEAFKVPPWQLLVDDKQLRTWMVGKLFSASEAVSNELVEQHYPLPPTGALAPPGRTAVHKRVKRRDK